MEIKHCEYSDTIRQFPQNYLIAYRTFNSWKCEPDLAADKKIATRCFLALFDYNTKYGSAENLINKIVKKS
jgi:hypothetical protein